MKKAKKAIIDFYNKWFTEPKEGEETKSRRLIQDPETGKLNWSDGEVPFEEEDLNSIKIEDTLQISDDSRTGVRTAHRMVPTPLMPAPFAMNRFSVNFPDIPPYYFNSYSYLGTDHASQKKLLTGSGVISDDYSVFSVVLLMPSDNFDICDRLKELERNPNVGDVSIELLDPVGHAIKTITLPNCEVVEIRAFRELSYGKFKEASDNILYGEIVVKHKQRKLK